MYMCHVNPGVKIKHPSGMLAGDWHTDMFSEAMTVVAAFLCIRPDLPIQSAKEHSWEILGKNGNIGWKKIHGRELLHFVHKNA